MIQIPMMNKYKITTFYTKGSYFVLGSETIDIIYPNNMAAAIPPAVASRPPEKAPITPLVLAPSIAPLLNAYPKPEIGTVAPAPPNFTNGSYTPMPPKNTPEVKNITKI